MAYSEQVNICRVRPRFEHWSLGQFKTYNTNFHTTIINWFQLTKNILTPWTQDISWTYDLLYTFNLGPVSRGYVKRKKILMVMEIKYIFSIHLNAPFWFNPFVPNAPFPYPLKISENDNVFWCFQAVDKWCIWNKWVKNTCVRNKSTIIKYYWQNPKCLLTT